MVIYNRDTDNLEDITVAKGHYTLIYKLKELPHTFKTEKLPKIITIAGKRGVLNSVILNENSKEVTVKVWIAENPIPLVFLAYAIGGVILSWGVSLVTGDLVSITKDVFNPVTLVIVGLIAVTIFGVPKVRSKL